MRNIRSSCPRSPLLYLLIVSMAFWPVSSPADNQDSKPDAAKNLSLILHDDFERDELTGWEFTDKSAWRITRTGDEHNRVIDQFRESKYQPAVRSPLNIALAVSPDLTDFVLDLKV